MRCQFSPVWSASACAEVTEYEPAPAPSACSASAEMIPCFALASNEQSTRVEYSPDATRRSTITLSSAAGGWSLVHERARSLVRGNEVVLVANALVGEFDDLLPQQPQCFEIARSVEIRNRMDTLKL